MEALQPKSLSNMATIQSIVIKYIIEINENKIFCPFFNNFCL